jgi:RNA polymerase sigma-70 factor (ECF subfamily)
MTNSQNELRKEIAQLLPRLRRFGLALAGSYDDGDDVVHGAVARALARSELWLPGTRLDSWLFKIMQNVWRDEVRRRKTSGLRSAGIAASAETTVDGRRVAETLLMLSETRERFARLPEDQRLALALVVIEGLSYREAAEQLDIPIGTLMSRLSRAREALRTMIDEGRTQQSMRTAAGE